MSIELSSITVNACMIQALELKESVILNRFQFDSKSLSILEKISQFNLGR
jgi:hypothetical protein